MSVDIVFTNDKSKWTKCPVVELANSRDLSIGGAERHALRKSSSKDKDGNDIEGTGMSYFPGYAIDVEKGRRLNMMFGENSFFLGENGGDMIWNPTANRARPGGGIGSVVFGGMHYVYVMETTYDEGESLKNKLETNSNAEQLANTYEDLAAWVLLPTLERGAELLSPADGLVPNDVTIRARVSKPYTKYDNNNDGTLEQPSYQFS